MDARQKVTPWLRASDVLMHTTRSSVLPQHSWRWFLAGGGVMCMQSLAWVSVLLFELPGQPLPSGQSPYLRMDSSLEREVECVSMTGQMRSSTSSWRSFIARCPPE